MRANAGDERRAVVGLELVEAASRRRAGRSPRGRRTGCGSRPAPRRRARRDRASGSSVGADVPRPGRAAGRGWRRCRGRSRSACASSSARWSTTPEMRRCRSPPPSSSAVTTSPVAAFTSGGPPRKIVPWLRDDHRLVAHRRHVRAARRARAEHRGDLRDAAGRHRGLVVEDAAEVVAVGEHLVLGGQEGAAGVDEVDARQPVLQRDLLGAQVLLDRHRVVRAALDGGVVGDDHALAARRPARCR